MSTQKQEELANHILQDSTGKRRKALDKIIQKAQFDFAFWTGVKNKLNQ